MEKFLAECVKETTIQDIKIGSVYCVEHELDYKVLYNETKKTFESVVGNKDWFYEHFSPIRCVCCGDREYCKVYQEGRDYACYGFEKEKNKSFEEILDEVDKSITVDELFRDGEIVEDSGGYETYYSDAPGGTYNRIKIVKLDGKFYVYKEKIIIDKDSSEKAECTAFYELK